uniref:Ig-like domain-containing protein n=1 Tax=Anopheles culicifacies TaxID=139723 RepID=A0A182LTD0_9DIPT
MPVFKLPEGNPTPKITWSSNGKMLPSAMIDYAHESTLSSRLVVRNLSRAHQHNVYSCQASNFYRRNVTANVTIELRLRPLTVEIVNGSSPLSADRRYIVQCQSMGSRPPAKITWWMGGVQLTATNQTVQKIVRFLSMANFIFKCHTTAFLCYLNSLLLFFKESLIPKHLVPSLLDVTSHDIT